MSHSLFEVAILEHPAKKSNDEAGVPKVVMFERVVAKDDQSAAINAVLNGTLPDGVDKTRLEVLVRPFSA